MDPVHFSEANRCYKAPKDWDAEKNGECADLHVYENDGKISSVWKPTEAELAMLNKGGCIVLTLTSQYQPPVMLWTTVVEPLSEETVAATAPEPVRVQPVAVVEEEDESASAEVEEPFDEVTDFKNGASALSAEEEHDTIPEVAEKSQSKRNG